MPKRRTTGCAQQHYGKTCSACTRVRVRRFRARRRADAQRLPLTDMQRIAKNADSYVREYLRRGAIAPPDACERCERDVQISPAHPLRKLHPWHPDPGQPQQIAWLCSDCRRAVRSTREPLTLTWTWPGLTAARSRKAPDLARLATKSAAIVDTKLLAAASASLRDAALIGTLVAALQPGERERLYAAGASAGPRWQPTPEARLNVLLRDWVFNERAARSSHDRAGGGTEVTPIDVAPRRSRRSALSGPPPESTTPRQPFDAQATQAAIERALERLDRANTVADETNARAVAALRARFGLSPRRS